MPVQAPFGTMKKPDQFCCCYQVRKTILDYGEFYTLADPGMIPCRPVTLTPGAFPN